MKIVKQMEAAGTNSGMPRKAVFIVNCGELKQTATESEASDKTPAKTETPEKVSKTPTKEEKKTKKTKEAPVDDSSETPSKRQRVETPKASSESKAKKTEAKAEKKEAPPADEQADEDMEREESNASNGRSEPAQKEIEKETQEVARKGFFSDQTFQSLALSQPTLEGLHDMGFKLMTKIQAKSIPPLLAGKDLLGAAK